MDIPGDILAMYRSGAPVEAVIERHPEYMRRNIRRWYRQLSSGAPLAMPDYRTIAFECRMTVIETPSINRSGEPVRPEPLGEYAVALRGYSCGAAARDSRATERAARGQSGRT